MPKDTQTTKKGRKTKRSAEPAPLYNHSERPFNSRRIVTASNVTTRGFRSALVPGQAPPLFGDHEEPDSLYAPIDLDVDDFMPRRPRGNSLTQEEQDRTGERVIKKAAAKRYANSVSLIDICFYVNGYLMCFVGCTSRDMADSPWRLSG